MSSKRIKPQPTPNYFTFRVPKNLENTRPYLLFNNKKYNPLSLSRVNNLVSVFFESLENVGALPTYPTAVRWLKDSELSRVTQATTSTQVVVSHLVAGRLPNLKRLYLCGVKASQLDLYCESVVLEEGADRELLDGVKWDKLYVTLTDWTNGYESLHPTHVIFKCCTVFDPSSIQVERLRTAYFWNCSTSVLRDVARVESLRSVKVFGDIDAIQSVAFTYVESLALMNKGGEVVDLTTLPSLVVLKIMYIPDRPMELVNPPETLKRIESHSSYPFTSIPDSVVDLTIHSLFTAEVPEVEGSNVTKLEIHRCNISHGHPTSETMRLVLL
uniref:Uncharacterized protein n=1 Tax=viral metagenome TaxID=1070528 RepID=A0A6C0JWA2_9ZZZZ